MSSETQMSNEELARAIPERVASEGELDLLDDLLTEEFVEHGPFAEYHGVAEARANIEELLEAFPDFTATVEDVVSSGDTVAMRVTLRGTHEGPFYGTEPTGTEFEIQNMVFTRIEDGRIAERWVLPDMLGMFQQLGIVEMEVPAR